jgi:hypothetical protein
MIYTKFAFLNFNAGHVICVASDHGYIYVLRFSEQITAIKSGQNTEGKFASTMTYFGQTLSRRSSRSFQTKSAHNALAVYGVICFLGFLGTPNTVNADSTLEKEMRASEFNEFSSLMQYLISTMVEKPITYLLALKASLMGRNFFHISFHKPAF